MNSPPETPNTHQVDKFGLSCGFLTQTIQANALTDATGSGEKSELQRTLLDTITRADLRNACKSEEAFDALYMVSWQAKLVPHRPYFAFLLLYVAEPDGESNCKFPNERTLSFHVAAEG